MAIVERSIGWVNNRLLGRNTWYSWAPASIIERWEYAEHYSRLANGEDKNYIRERAEGIGGSNPAYLTIPLAARINRTSANLLFGETPRISIEDEADQTRLNQLIEQNKLYSKLKRAAEGVSCVGGIYGLAYVDTRTPRGQAGSLIRFVPERRAVPEFANDDELVAVTFVSEFTEGGDDKPEVWRLLEKHTPGLIENRLHRGTRTELGKEVALDALAQTQGLVPDLNTGLDVLDVVYIPNHLGASSPLGISDLAGIEDLLLACNEALTLASDDARAAAATVFARQDLLTEDGNMAEGSRVVPVTLEESGDDDKPLLEVIQPQVRAETFAKYQDYLIDLTLQSAGFAPQSLGRNVQGGAESGTARRLMMHHTLIEHAGKAMLWEGALRQLLDVARQLDAQDYDGKPAASWNDLEAPIDVVLADGMPEDIRETATAVRDLRGAGALSLEQAVRMVMRDQSEEAIQGEIERLEEEQGRITREAAAAVNAETPDVDGILSDLGF